MNAANENQDNNEQSEDYDEAESDYSYGDDPILGNTVIIKTNISDNEENKDDNQDIQELEQSIDYDATDIEIAWDIVEIARINLEKMLKIILYKNK